MKIIEIRGSKKSRIVVGESISSLPSYCGKGKKVIITDKRVRKLHGSLFPKGWPVIEIGEGETHKTLKTVEMIYSKLLELGVDRFSTIVGIGGGIVCDVAGFAASTYLRGLDFGFVPTTLLAQVDASIGGKNGVNFKGYKNIIGTINQPNFVLCDLLLLRTLPKSEIRNGFAEIIKYAAIANAELFSFLEQNVDKALSLELHTMEKIIHRSLKIKASIVSVDERESGKRRMLNFGHTLGHAIESTTGIKHGEAISIGMVAAARLSVAKGMLAKEEAARLENLLSSYGLPTEIKGKAAALIDAMEKDKKRQQEEIHFVFLEAIGKARIEKIPLHEVMGVLKWMSASA